MPLHRERDPPTIPPLGTERVDLIEEDHTWRTGSGALEHLPHATLALAHVLVQQLGTFDGDEVGATLVRHRLRKKRLAAARRTIQQHACWHGETHGSEELWIANGFDDADSKLLSHVRQRADVVPRGVGHCDEALALGGGLHLLQRQLEVVHVDGELAELVLGDGGALLDLFGDFDAFGDVGVSVVGCGGVCVCVVGVGWRRSVWRGVEGFDEEAVEDAIDGDDGCFFRGR